MVSSDGFDLGADLENRMSFTEDGSVINVAVSWKNPEIYKALDEIVSDDNRLYQLVRNYDVRYTPGGLYEYLPVSRPVKEVLSSKLFNEMMLNKVCSVANQVDSNLVLVDYSISEGGNELSLLTRLYKRV